jgi:hypothetical protein
MGNKLCAPEHAPVETLDRMLSHLSELDMFPYGMDHTSTIPFYGPWSMIWNGMDGYQAAPPSHSFRATLENF